MKRLTAILLAGILVLTASACGVQNPPDGEASESGSQGDLCANTIPETLSEIPEEYFSPADNPGMLEDLYYGYL